MTTVTPVEHKVVIDDSGGVVVVTAGVQGPPGPIGPAGSVTPNTDYNAAFNLSGHRAVYVNDSKLLEYADNTTAAHANRVFGITIRAVAGGSRASVMIFGKLTEPSWSWFTGQSIFLGADGQLQQTRPSSGFVLKLGYAVSNTTMFVDIKSPIFL